MTRKNKLTLALALIAGIVFVVIMVIVRSAAARTAPLAGSGRACPAWQAPPDGAAGTLTISRASDGTSVPLLTRRCIH